MDLVSSLTDVSFPVLFKLLTHLTVSKTYNNVNLQLKHKIVD